MNELGLLTGGSCPWVLLPGLLACHLMLHSVLVAAPPPQVTAIFGSSVEVMVSVWGETPDIGVMFHCGDAYATVVSGVLGACWVLLGCLCVAHSLCPHRVLRTRS